MTRALALAVALVAAGCHRQVTADVTLDADADARNATEAKIDADLAAADAAARAPMPHAPSRPAPSGAEPADPAPAEDGNGG